MWGSLCQKKKACIKSTQINKKKGQDLKDLNGMHFKTELPWEAWTPVTAGAGNTIPKTFRLINDNVNNQSWVKQQSAVENKTWHYNQSFPINRRIFMFLGVDTTNQDNVKPQINFAQKKQTKNKNKNKNATQHTKHT